MKSTTGKNQAEKQNDNKRKIKIDDVLLPEGPQNFESKLARRLRAIYSGLLES